MTDQKFTKVKEGDKSYGHLDETKDAFKASLTEVYVTRIFPISGGDELGAFMQGKEVDLTEGAWVNMGGTDILGDSRNDVKLL